LPNPAYKVIRYTALHSSPSTEKRKIVYNIEVSPCRKIQIPDRKIKTSSKFSDRKMEITSTGNKKKKETFLTVKRYFVIPKVRPKNDKAFINPIFFSTAKTYFHF